MNNIFSKIENKRLTHNKNFCTGSVENLFDNDL